MKKYVKRFNQKKYKLRRVLNKQRKRFPTEFPFWARMKISKNRTTLVIDDEPIYNKTSKKFTNNFVHREAIHTYKKDYEEIFPNPDLNDPRPMYLKRPAKMNQKLFNPHNKKLSMPKKLQECYARNNKK